MKKTRNEENWELLGSFLKESFIDPLYKPSFIFYFLFIVVGIGSFGIIYDIINLNYGCNLFLDKTKINSLLMNMTNVGLSITSVSVFDLIFISSKKLTKKIKKEDQKEDQEEELIQNKYLSLKRDIGVMGISLLVIEFVLWIFVNTLFEIFVLRVLFAVTSLTIGYYVWWISNSKNRLLIKDTNLKDSRDLMGGNNPSHIKLTGNLKQFNT